MIHDFLQTNYGLWEKQNQNEHDYFGTTTLNTTLMFSTAFC